MSLTHTPNNKQTEDPQEELARLKAKCAFLERVVHEVPANIYISDLQKGVVWCNKTNEETLGYTLDEILQMGGLAYFQQVVHPDDQDIPQNSIDHYQRFEGLEFGGVFRAKHKREAEYRWFVGWARTFARHPDGGIKEILCVDVDLSPQMNTEKQLIAALRENLQQKNALLLRQLRKREVEVLTLICQGLSTKAIADKLFISEHTVKTHRKNIQAKMGTANVAELVSLAREAGLG